MAQLIQRGLVDTIGATETRQYKDKTFVSRSIIIEQPSFDPYTGEKRSSNYIKFEATREETCRSLDNFKVGNKVDVEFIVRGSKYDKKDGSGKDVFTHLELRSITLAGATAQPQAPVAAQPVAAATPIPAAPAPAAPAVPDYDSELGF